MILDDCPFIFPFTDDPLESDSDPPPYGNLATPPVVRSPLNVVTETIGLMKLNQSDVVYDLGCGDGDVVCSIGELIFLNGGTECPKKIVGIDKLKKPLIKGYKKWIAVTDSHDDRIQEKHQKTDRLSDSCCLRSTIQRKGLDTSVAVEFLQYDFMDESEQLIDILNEATVVYAYLTPTFINKRRFVEQLKLWLSENGIFNRRLISYMYPINEFQNDSSPGIHVQIEPVYQIYVYSIDENN